MSYLHYIGIDVSKNWFDVALFGTKKGKNYDYSEAGISTFLEEYREQLKDCFVVLEATGGYEMCLLSRLYALEVHIHRATGYQTRQFAHSFGKKAKNDTLDAACLALYGKERHLELSLYVLPNEAQQRLTALASRLADLTAMLLQEENRVQHHYAKVLEPKSNADTGFFAPIMTAISQQIINIRLEMTQIVANNAEMAMKYAVLCENKGIADKTALVLLSYLPELGKLTRREVAALSGLAPYERSSGNFKGKGRIYGGRAIVKLALFRACWSATRFNPQISVFYQRLVAKGKSKMAAMCASARKLITIVNAQIRDKLVENADKKEGLMQT